MPATWAAASSASRTRSRCCSSIATRSGRDPAEIERTAGLGIVVIRDSHAEAERVLHEIADYNGGARTWPNQAFGTPEEVADMLRPYLEIGYRHLIGGFPSPYDRESMERFATDVRPMLEAA